jgi:phosphocarrier protein FPr/phosphocarrier protein
MLPMVATLDELRQVRRMLDEERAMLGVGPVALGIMVEVPSAALLAEAFAREVDFFSIGSNDLTQYTLAMDRGHPQLAAQADALHPAVLRLIDMTCRGAATHGRWVGLCGALASDPLAAPLLVGLGISELSVSTPAIAAVKAALARVSSDQCRDLAAAALALEDAAAVRQLLDAAGKSA